MGKMSMEIRTIDPCIDILKNLGYIPASLAGFN